MQYQTLFREDNNMLELHIQILDFGFGKVVKIHFFNLDFLKNIFVLETYFKYQKIYDFCSL